MVIMMMKTMMMMMMMSDCDERCVMVMRDCDEDDEDDEDDENENEDDGGAIANYAFFSKGRPVAALVKDGDCSSDHVCNVVTC